MATCNICGKDAGYLSSLCGECRADLPARPENAKSAPTPYRNPLRIDPSDRVKNGSFVKILLVWAAALTTGLVVLVLVGGDSPSEKVGLAKELVERQVASDISLTFDESSLQLYRPGGKFYYVCGMVTLNRPGDSPISLNNVTQRFITTVNQEMRAGTTLFDGSSSSVGITAFQLQWDRNCR